MTRVKVHSDERIISVRKLKIRNVYNFMWQNLLKMGILCLYPPPTQSNAYKNLEFKTDS